MRIQIRKTTVLLTIFMLFFLLGCARSTTESFVRPEFDLAFINKVAVLPFENPANDVVIAERCRQVTITQILSSGLFDVVDKMQVDSSLTSQAVVPGTPIDASTLRRLGQILGVQGFIVGSLDEALVDQKGASTFLDISLTMRLIDSESGLVVWQASGRGSGYSVWDRLFGLASKDSFQVTRDLIRNLLGTMGKRSEEQS
jgi:TolB-like protein